MTYSRRDFLATSGTAVGALALGGSAFGANKKRKKLAVVATIYRENSHADHIAGRFLTGYTVKGEHHRPDYDVVSMHVEQIGNNDLSRGLSKKFGFRMCKTVSEALTLDAGALAVDGVLLIGEHGDYPENKYEQKLYPRHRLMSRIVDVFRKSQRSVPVFNDKHLSYFWKKAKQMVDWSRELKFPLQAGSSLPVTWRRPELEFPLGTPMKEALVVAFSHPERYGFHALETLQCHVERRKGGESGIKAVTALRGDAVWKAGEAGEWSQELMHAALSRSRTIDPGQVRDNARTPEAFLLEYRDGFRATVLLLSGHVADFTFATKLANGKVASTLHYLPNPPGAKYFDALSYNIERMLAAGKAVIPIERTLLISGALESLMHSRFEKSRRTATPHLDVSYKPPANSGFFRGPVDAASQRCYFRDEAIYRQYDAVWKEFVQLRKRRASDGEWRAFAKRVRAMQRKTVSHLLRVASAKNRTAQCLLFAIRDYLPAMLKNSRVKPSRDEKEFRRNMEIARELLRDHESLWKVP